MPRHTNSPAVRKHDRAHVRTQRERYIAKRFRRAKRDGTFKQAILYPRSSYSGTNSIDGNARIEDALRALFDAHGYAFTGSSVAPHSSYGREPVHPDIIRYLPRWLRRSVSLSLPAGGSTGQLADRDSFYRYRCDCAGCRPQKQDGYRSRQKTHWQRELAAEAEAEYVAG